VTPQGLVLIDGVRAEDPRVSVYDRGFLYGDSVFEVIRTYGGKPFGLEEHVARLHRSAKKIAMELPWTEPALLDEINGAVRAGNYPEAYIRVIVTRGVGLFGLDPEFADTPTRVVMIHPLTLPPLPVYRDGVAVFLVDSMRATDGTSAEGAKSSNYLANLLALREAKRHGCYEPVFVQETPSGREVLEGGTSNVFAIEGKTLVTPPERRILGGITRKHVLEAAPAAGLTVRIEPLTLERFRSADELFLTSTVRELVPIVRIVEPTGSQSVGTGVPGALVRAIHRAFRAHVGAPTSPMPWEQPS
jgi:branched-chain amino acid aminotransferase